MRPAGVLLMLIMLAGCAATTDYSALTDEQLQESASRCITALRLEAKPEERSPAYPDVLGNQNELMRMGVRAAPYIHTALGSAGKELKKMLIPVLGEIGTDAALTKLREMYAAETFRSVKDELAVALGMHADETVLERLFTVASREKYPARRAHAVAALSRYKEKKEVVRFLVGLLDDKTPVYLSQKVLSGLWPFRGYAWALDEHELRDFALAALAILTGETHGYTRGDGPEARMRAVAKWKSHSVTR
jgi:HEAT repeat protein